MEKNYLKNIINNKKLTFYSVQVSFLVFVLLICVYTYYYEDELTLSVLTLFAYTPFFAYSVIQFTRRLEDADAFTKKALRGPFSEGDNPFGAGFEISGQPITLPQHWLGYLKSGQVIDGHVLDSETTTHLLDVDNGLSVEEELKHGLLRLLDPALNPLPLIACAFGLFLSMSIFVIFFLAPEAPPLHVDAHWSVDGLLIGPALLALGRIAVDCQRRRRIYRMYEEKGVEGLTLQERRRHRLWSAGKGALISLAVAGALVAFIPQAGLWTAVLVVTLGATGAAAVEQPRPQPE